MGSALGAAESVTIPVDYPIPIESTGVVDAHKICANDTIHFVISENLRKGNCIVFRKGTPVTLLVRESVPSGSLGRPSRILMEPLSTRAVDGHLVFLKGSVRVEGEDFDVESVGVTAMCCLGVFLKGSEQNLGRGLGTVAFTRHETAMTCESQR
jgi:hypothetical protein